MFNNIDILNDLEVFYNFVALDSLKVLILKYLF